MEETDFTLLWKTYHQKIDETLAINKKLVRETINGKAESTLRKLSGLKTRGIIALVIYLLVLGLVLSYAISHYTSAANYFIVSIGIIFLINVKALYDYIKHLVWVHNIDYSGNITDIQTRLTRLQLSIFKHSRIMVLQFPFWTTAYLTDLWFPQDVGIGYYIFQFLLTGSFTFLAFWLYKNQTIENADKKWLKILIKGSGGGSVAKAIEFYKELEAYKRDGENSED